MKRLTKIFQALLGVCALTCTLVLVFGRLVWRKTKQWWNKRSKLVKVVIAVVFPLVILSWHLYCEYYYYFVPYNRISVTERIKIHRFKYFEHRIYDVEEERYLTSRFDWYRTFEEYGDSVAIYAKGEKRGFFNIYTGEIIVDLEENDYSRAWKFSEGLAAVVKDNKVGFINSKNEIVIPFIFDYYDDGWDFDYVFHGGVCRMINKEGLLGLIDTDGNWLLAPEYNDIWDLRGEGYRVVVQKGKFGVVDARGKIVYPTEYVYARVDNDGIELTKAGKNWKVDFEGNVIRPFMFGDIIYSDENKDYAVYEVWGDYGILNLKTGQPVTPAIYSEIYFVTDKYFRVQDLSSYEYYLVDLNGDIVVED